MDQLSHMVHVLSRRPSERGAASVEFALLVPLFLVLTGVVVGGGRVWLARSALEQVAAASARTASLANNATQAVIGSRAMAEGQLGAGDVRCENVAVDTRVDAFALPPGQPGEVRVHLRCSVPLSDVLVPGWPGTVSLEATGLSILERYRGRS